MAGHSSAMVLELLQHAHGQWHMGQHVGGCCVTQGAAAGLGSHPCRGTNIAKHVLCLKPPRACCCVPALSRLGRGTCGGAERQPFSSKHIQILWQEQNVAVFYYYFFCSLTKQGGHR